MRENRSPQPGFVIDSLPRSGSTTLARLIASHPNIRCAIEPFHPTLHGGGFNAMAVASKSVGQALNLIWHRWEGFKHVWDSNGWPFNQCPEINDGIILGAGRVVVLQRRNLLRRLISGIISQQLRFWIGSRDEFLRRLESIQLRALDPIEVQKQLIRDRKALEGRSRLIDAQLSPIMKIYYEDLYGENIALSNQVLTLNRILAFLGFDAHSEYTSDDRCRALLDHTRTQWASEEVYTRIPGIHAVEEQVGSDETGWLFR